MRRSVQSTPASVAISSFYARASASLRRELDAAIPPAELAELERRRPWRHFLVLLRMIAVLAGSVAGAALLRPWWAWVPCSVAIGFTVFGFTILLHEVVHGVVLARASRLHRVLGWVYAFPSGLSRTQFTRWHLDHHAQLGDAQADPKRHHLSPKKNARWLKALYLTPALYFLYFRAAAREAATYPAELRARIARERVVTIGGQLAILGAIVALCGTAVAVRVYVAPYFLVFPVVFTLNRLGQHYAIDPDDTARWSTLVRASRFWDFAFLWSNYHLEHHYFPSVPFYNLRRLHHRLAPFYAARGMVAVGYGELLVNWFWRNQAPHTKWSEAR